MSQIELRGVSKTYKLSVRKPGLRGALAGAFSREKKIVEAVRDISFSVEAGELVGYIGPNGAGKSTTVKMMSGILMPDAGEIRIMGRVPYRERRAHVARIGVVFGQKSQLWWDTPAIDSFNLLRDIYSVSEADYAKRLDELAEMLSARELFDTPVRQLSLGQRMKCELIGSLLHAPDILFLDEPTIGLDAVSKIALRKFLGEMNSRGVTMILTTHDMDDISALCSRVMVIGRGRLLFDGSMDDMKKRYAPYRVMKVRFEGEPAQFAPEGAMISKISGRAGEFAFCPNEVRAEDLISSVARVCPISDITIEAPDAESIVAKMYGEMGV